VITIDSNFSPEFQASIKAGIALIDKIWPITQTLTFTPIRGRTRNGWCRRDDENTPLYTIGINKNLVNPNDIIEVVIHEILHSYAETCYDHHGGEWKKRADIINQRYPDIHIQRTGHLKKNISDYKTFVMCNNCEHIYGYTNTPYTLLKSIARNEGRFRCGQCNSSDLVKISKATALEIEAEKAKQKEREIV